MLKGPQAERSPAPDLCRTQTWTPHVICIRTRESGDVIACFTNARIGRSGKVKSGRQLSKGRQLHPKHSRSREQSVLPPALEKGPRSRAGLSLLWAQQARNQNAMWMSTFSYVWRNQCRAGFRARGVSLRLVSPAFLGKRAQH